MMTYKLSKLGQTDLVFGLWSEFISRSVRAGLQVSVCSGYNVCNLVNTQTRRQRDSFWPVILLAQPAELEAGWANSSKTCQKLFVW